MAKRSNLALQEVKSEKRSEKAQTSTDQKCQQSIKARIPREGPAEEEGGCVEEKKH